MVLLDYEIVDILSLERDVEKFIVNRNKFHLINKSKFKKSIASLNSLSTAKILASILINQNWNLKFFNFPKLFKFNNKFYIFKFKKDKIIHLGIYDSIENAEKRLANIFKDSKSTSSDGVNWSLDDKNWGNQPKLPNKDSYVYSYCGDQWQVSKSIKGKNTVFGRFDSYDVAVFVRDRLIENDWKVSFFRRNPELEFGGEVLSFKVVNGRIELVDGDKSVNGRFLEEVRDKYISRLNGVFYIQKSINGRTISFGRFDSRDVAVFVRDRLIENDWKVSFFRRNPELEFGGEVLSFKVVNGRIELVDGDNSVDGKFSKNVTGKHISERNGVFYIQKSINGRTISFGRFDSRDVAVFVRDRLIENDWKVSFFRRNPELEFGGEVLSFKVVNDSIMLDDEDKSVNGKSSKKVKNKYISRLNGVFYIQKSINGRTISFGRFDSRDVAVFVRDRLIENDWKVSFFRKNPRLEFNNKILSFEVNNKRIELISYEIEGNVVSCLISSVRPRRNKFEVIISNGDNNSTKVCGTFEDEKIANFVSSELNDNNCDIEYFRNNFLEFDSKYLNFIVENNKIRLLDVVYLR